MQHPLTTITSPSSTPTGHLRGRRVRAALAATSVAVLLAACGGGEETGAAVAADEVDAEHNEADIAFAQQMVPHHEQAVMMSQLAEGRAESPEVVELAEEIEAAQGPEIETMTTFLEVWGAAAPTDMAGHDMADMDSEEMDSEGMDPADMEGMAGMMSEQQMGALEDSSGPDFDRMFLENMIAHHEGAIEMADAEVADGVNPQAVALAGEIAEAQAEEIATMTELLPEG